MGWSPPTATSSNTASPPAKPTYVHRVSTTMRCYRPPTLRVRWATRLISHATIGCRQHSYTKPSTATLEPPSRGTIHIATTMATIVCVHGSAFHWLWASSTVVLRPSKRYSHHDCGPPMDC